MKNLSDQELDRLIQQIGRKAPTGPCPLSTNLLAYHRKELPQELVDELCEHFSQCEKCAAEILRIINAN